MPENDEYNVVALGEREGRAVKPDHVEPNSGAPAWALIDFDTKDMPPNVAASIEAAGGMWNALLTVAPGLLEQNIEVRKAVPVAITETKERSTREGAV
jgi:hypothetical protein